MSQNSIEHVLLSSTTNKTPTPPPARDNVSLIILGTHTYVQQQRLGGPVCQSEERAVTVGSGGKGTDKDGSNGAGTGDDAEGGGSDGDNVWEK